MKNFDHPKWLIGFLVLGSVLRLIWLEDMEWKFDEIYMYHYSTKGLLGRDFPLLGMPSGAGIPNPGMSMWIFILLGKLSNDPLGMTRWVQLLNVGALWGFYFLFRKFIPVNRISPWYWGLALAAVSPLAVLFSRKIWAQCVLLPFCLLFLFCHFKRDKKLFGFIGGLTGMILGQIHMSGFFFFAGVGLWSIYEDFKGKRFNYSDYIFWIIGACVGIIPMLPWIQYLLDNPPASDGHSVGWKNIFKFKFFAHWFAEGFGIHLKYSFKKDFYDFLSMPSVFGIKTYLIGLIHIFLGSTGVFVCFEWLLRKIKRQITSSSINLFPEARFYIFATAMSMGIIISLSGVNVHPHYQIVVFPFIYLWTVMMLWNRKWLLKTVVVLQLVLTLSLMLMVHLNGGIPNGDYGISYRMQKELGILKFEPEAPH